MYSLSNSTGGGSSAPVNMTVSDTLFQNSYYLAVNFNGILFGVELVLYYLLLAGVSSALMLFSTINVAVDAVFGQEMWVVNAGFPGGPGAYFAANANVWYQTMGSAASMLLVQVADGLLIYRCYVVWPSRWVIAFPCFLFVATFALFIAEIYSAGIPSGSLFAGDAALIELAWLSSTITMNVIVTSVICGRLIYFRRRLRSQFEGGIGQTYSRAATIIVESALPYALTGVAGIISYGVNSDISMLLLSIWAMTTCICPLMIILRVAQGSGVTGDRVAKSTTRPALSVPYEVETYRTEHDSMAIHLRDLAGPGNYVGKTESYIGKKSDSYGGNASEKSVV